MCYRLRVKFTTENARLMAARAIEVRERNRLLAATEPTPAPVATDSTADYVGARLARVRAQILRVDDMLYKETDPLGLDRLARTLGTLEEIERLLAGRPLPGSRRPGKDRPALEAEVEPL